MTSVSNDHDIFLRIGEGAGLGSYGAYYARTHRGEGEGLPPSPVFFGEDEEGIDELWSVPFLDALPGILAQVDREQESAPVWPLLPGMKGMRSQSEEGPVGTTVISYTYDPLNRLRTADYSTGAYFYYTYDAVGNRLSKETYGGVVTTYEYDDANRLDIVDDGIGAPQEYSWNDNGSLLSDGESTYTYNKANRLVSITSSEHSVNYEYNGLGDRMQQTVDGVTTGYTLDIAAGLTQVLVDDSQTYFYGVGRIGQQGGGSAAYFLADALGSVRQLVDGGGEVTLAKDYRPYGEVGGSWGSELSVFGFAGEATDVTGLVYLRARYYSPGQGRFISRDTWAGDSRMPMSYNRWAYGFANPVLYVDQNGRFPWIPWILLGLFFATNIPGDSRLYETPPANVLAGDLSLRALNDPYDAYRTFQDCCNGNCSIFDIVAGILPVVPGGLKKLGDFIKMGDAAQTLKLFGSWVEHSPHMSKIAREYQSFATGIEPGWEFMRNGVKFDGVRIDEAGQAVLLEAKYADGMDSFYYKHNELPFARTEVLEQAYKQLESAEGLVIEWHFSDEIVANSIRELFKSEEIGIKVIYTKWVP